MGPCFQMDPHRTWFSLGLRSISGLYEDKYALKSYELKLGGRMSFSEIGGWG